MPQSVCSRYGLAIGPKVAPAVRALVWICFPIAYPISKLSDYFLGNGHVTLFHRAEVQTLVDFHGNEAGNGGELTHDETIIIAGALQLTQKIAKDTMTPISYTFVVDINAKLDRYDTIMSNYLALVKNLLTTHPADEAPVKSVTIRKIPRYIICVKVTATAVVIRTNDAPVEQQESKTAADDIVKDVKARSKKWDRDILQIDEYPLPKLAEEEETVGIITMEDVIEELLQEEIFDETDKSLRGFIT
ncbi:hypothetical protein GIB67_036854 [Kingdonia uniflora]|uniref:CNNM transmembrane domain-containing protein n=1 Tax=Kingdonia uniflora TaxID=39325 RepID=A0A7J7LX09_9MAGN|nr:hypothetical protein GIB67_036854 [Kingdonia uniflora]